MPNVRGTFLPQAIERLNESGYENIEVVQQVMDDMPADVVVGQYPEPGFYPFETPILLVVVRPLNRLPDLRGWRADHALVLIEALDFRGRLQDPDADPTGSVVTTQRPPPGPVLPGSAVLLVVEPVQAETVTITQIDTVRVREVDTLTVTERVEVPAGPREQRVDTVFTAVDGGRSLPSIPLVTVVTLVGAGLGFVGCRLIPRSGRRPVGTASATAEPPSEPVARTRPPDLPAFSAAIADEAIWVRGGRLRVQPDQPRQGG